MGSRVSVVGPGFIPPKFLLLHTKDAALCKFTDANRENGRLLLLLLCKFLCKELIFFFFFPLKSGICFVADESGSLAEEQIGVMMKKFFWTLTFCHRKYRIRLHFNHYESHPFSFFLFFSRTRCYFMSLCWISFCQFTLSELLIIFFFFNFLMMASRICPVRFCSLFLICMPLYPD